MKKITDEEYLDAIVHPNTRNSHAIWGVITKENKSELFKKYNPNYAKSACYSSLKKGDGMIFTYSLKEHMVNVDICREYLKIISSMKGMFRTRLVETKDRIGIVYNFNKKHSRKSMLLALTMFRFSNETHYQSIAVVMSYLMSRDKIKSNLGEINIDKSNPWNLLLVSSMFDIGSGHTLRLPTSIPRFLKSYESFKYNFSEMKIDDKRSIHDFCSTSQRHKVSHEVNKVVKKHKNINAGSFNEISMMINNPGKNLFMNIKSLSDLNNTLHYLLELSYVMSKESKIKK